MNSRNQNIFAVVLAAGQSSRFGSTKQLAVVEGASLIQRSTAVATQTCGDRVIVICGADWQNVMQSAGNASHFFAHNETYADGIGSSIALAARICEKRASAMLLLLADQPLITSQHLQDLINAWSGNTAEIVASAYSDTAGPPILFASDAFPYLCRLSGDIGARGLLNDPMFDIASVPFEAAAIDIDTAADLRSL